jgi:hypothetical protein
MFTLMETDGIRRAEGSGSDLKQNPRIPAGLT